MQINPNRSAAIVALVLVAPYISLAQTVTNASLQAEITSLLTEVQQLETQLAAQGGSWCYIFNANLSIGMSGPAVSALQSALQKNGESVTANGSFDGQTAAAVTDFQKKYASQILAPYGLSHGTGYAGKSTRAELNTLYECGSTSAPVSMTTPLVLPPISVSTTTSQQTQIILQTSVPTPTQAVNVSFSPRTFNFSIAAGESPNVYPVGIADFIVSPDEPVAWTWSAPPSWLLVNAGGSRATNTSTLIVGIGAAAADLPVGTYSGTVTISPSSDTTEMMFTPQSIAVNLTVTPAGAVNATPMTNISINPTTITLGQSAIITWSSRYATNCTVVVSSNPGVTLIAGTGGSGSFTPTSTGVYAYTLTCTGSGGTSNPALATLDVTGSQTTATTASTSPTFQITSPNGDETWQAGTTQRITWTSRGYPASSPVEVLVYDTRYGASDDILELPEMIATVGAGSYSVAIPSAAPAGSDYKGELQMVTSPLGAPTSVSTALFSITATSVAPTSSAGAMTTVRSN